MNRHLPVTLVAGVVLAAGCTDRESPTVVMPAESVALRGDHNAAALVPSAFGIAKDQIERGPITTSSLVLPYFGSYGGPSPAFAVWQTGSSQAASFRNTSSTNATPALIALHGGSGVASHAGNYGTGMAASFEITNANSGSDVLKLATAGYGNLLNATHTADYGRAGMFKATAAGNPLPALEARHSGVGAALLAENTGAGLGAVIRSVGPNSINSALTAFHDGTAHTAHFVSGFPTTKATLRLEATGTGPALQADKAGSQDIAIFRSSTVSGYVNQARIDRTGKGFFNGGTQTGGADIAESFEVDGRVADYRPGDVLVISTRTDRRVTRSAEPYSTRVVGVHATKPGVLLTERGIDESLVDMVPVGVVGVIPTRVSAENGAIRRGDILVTAATPGHAMRTDPVIVNGVKLYPTGAILGKALQEFAGPGTGTIIVLVNVK